MYHATAAERREFEAGPVPELMPQFGRRQVASVVGAANVAAVSPSTALSWPWGRVAHRRLAPPPGFEPGPSEPKSWPCSTLMYVVAGQGVGFVRDGPRRTGSGRAD
ncbi:MAG: hypothetical protein ACQEXM_20230 [Actinomycetota bacterium]